MTKAETGALTFREFGPLLRRHRLSEQAESYRFGVLAAGIYNTAGLVDKQTKEPVPAFHPHDFFGDAPREKVRPVSRRDVARANYGFLAGLANTKTGIAEEE